MVQLHAHIHVRVQQTAPELTQGPKPAAQNREWLLREVVQQPGIAGSLILHLPITEVTVPIPLITEVQVQGRPGLTGLLHLLPPNQEAFIAEVLPQAAAAEVTEAAAALRVDVATAQAAQGHQDPPPLPLHPEEGDKQKKIMLT